LKKTAKRREGSSNSVARAPSRLSKTPDRKIILKRRSDSKNQLRKKSGLNRRKYPAGYHPNTKKQWWKKGKSANPKGRPRKEVCITSLVKQYLGEIADTRTGKTHAALVAEALVAGMIDQNPIAIKEMLARIDGAVKQRIELEGSSSVEISIGELARELVKRKKKRRKKKR